MGFPYMPLRLYPHGSSLGESAPDIRTQAAHGAVTQIAEIQTMLTSQAIMHRAW